MKLYRCSYCWVVLAWDKEYAGENAFCPACKLPLETMENIDTLSKPSVVSDQSIYECLTDTKGVVMTTDGDRRKFAQAIHNLLTGGK